MLPSDQSGRMLKVNFPTTKWMEVGDARSPDGTLARQALEQLIECYWHPVYCYIRHKGRSHEEAKDLTQEFFTTFLEKDAITYADRERGKFRTFLLASIGRFLALEHRTLQRRPSEIGFADFGAVHDGELEFEPADNETPESAFMRNWAKSVVKNCVTRLRKMCTTLGREKQFLVFEARFLQEKPAKARAVAAELGISETDVANYLHRAKRYFRSILQDEVMKWVDSPEEVNEEINGLLALLSSD